MTQQDCPHSNGWFLNPTSLQTSILLFYATYFTRSIASKVLSNRLKIFMAEIISDCKSEFVPRSLLITNNVLIAYDNLKKTQYETIFLMKIDPIKAYDGLERPYLRGSLTKLGFSSSWIDIVRCVIEVRDDVRING